MNMSLSLRKMFEKPLLACIPMVVAVYLLSPYSVFLRVGAAVVTYPAAFYLFKGFLAEDKGILENVLPGPVRGILIKRIF